MQSVKQRVLALYLRQDCTLCEEMARELAGWQMRLGFDVVAVDIDADEALTEAYDHKVPVLVDGDTEICHHFLDEQQLLAHLRAPDERTLYDKIYQVVRQIPAGRVATYGQVAAIVGSGSARTVGYAMAAVKQPEIPWQRVLNSQGRISVRAGGVEDSRQRELLRGEGVMFDRRGRVDFEQVGWAGPDMDWLERNGFFPAPRPWNRK